MAVNLLDMAYSIYMTPEDEATEEEAENEETTKQVPGRCGGQSLLYCHFVTPGCSASL